VRAGEALRPVAMSPLFRAARLCTAGCVLLAFGCGDDAGPGGLPAEVRVELGTGRKAFEALPEGSAVPLIQGIQGAYHVWTSFRAYGFDGDLVRMNLTTRWDIGDESMLEMSGSMAVRPTTDEAGVPASISLGWPALVYEGPCANGRMLQVDIAIVDMSGHSASDHRDWIVDVAEDLRATDCGG
jgi:hypothetical protein